MVIITSNIKKILFYNFIAGNFPTGSATGDLSELPPGNGSSVGVFGIGIGMSKKTGIRVTDSAPLRVCGNIRIPRHKLSEELARWGKTSIGWFCGSGLHRVINHIGGLMAVRITAGNIGDRKPAGKMADALGENSSVTRGLSEKNLQRNYPGKDPGS